MGGGKIKFFLFLFDKHAFIVDEWVKCTDKSEKILCLLNGFLISDI
jgi:hypothetical protein